MRGSDWDFGSGSRPRKAHVPAPDRQEVCVADRFDPEGPEGAGPDRVDPEGSPSTSVSRVPSRRTSEIPRCSVRFPGLRDEEIASAVRLTFIGLSVRWRGPRLPAPAPTLTRKEGRTRTKRAIGRLRDAAYFLLSRIATRKIRRVCVRFQRSPCRKLVGNEGSPLRRTAGRSMPGEWIPSDPKARERLGSPSAAHFPGSYRTLRRDSVERGPRRN